MRSFAILMMAFVLISSCRSFFINRSIGVALRRLARTSSRRPKQPITYSGSLSSRTKTLEDVDADDLIFIENRQRTVPLNVDRIRDQMYVIMKILNVEDFTVSIDFVSEAAIREENKRLRSKSKSTDVISVRMNKFSAPEVISKLNEQEKHLGEMIVSPVYVKRQCMSDEVDFKNGELDLADDAGCSKHMATKFTVEERLPLLLIHSALHMLGHDHETDEDWKVMTQREEEVIKAFNDHYSAPAKVT